MTVRDAPWLVFANRFTDTLADGLPPGLAREAVRQAVRKVWLLRRGDILVTPTPISPALRAYACDVLGLAPSDTVTLAVPDAQSVPLADAVERGGLSAALKAVAAQRPGLRMLPYALDRPTVRLASALGLPLHLYGPAPVDERTVAEVYRLNTKIGFRETATGLGIPVPEGTVCADRRELHAAVRALSERGDVFVKPARSGNGYGITRLRRGAWGQVREALEQHLARPDLPPGSWIVEESIAPARDVSVQAEVHADGTAVLFDGQMRMTPGGYASHGYQCGLQAPTAVRNELAGMARRLGRHLRDSGYRGPFSLDARLTPDGRIYGTESNVRRTGTTTPHALVRRLTAREPGPSGGFAWLYDTGRPTPRSPHGLAEGVDRLTRTGLAHDPATGHRVVLMNDPDVSGAWSYLAIAPDTAQLLDVEQRLRSALALH
ncbi:hypothetical protein ACIQI7_33455 [Kitasatospora sp. NPDC092039]|uniref:preATP grasp domain-containing protein n=1 Tax=Kitasatospora sp. NPDC092039 TaxID=3364086 RepID=UPI003821EF2C